MSGILTVNGIKKKWELTKWLTLGRGMRVRLNKIPTTNIINLHIADLQ